MDYIEIMTSFDNVLRLAPLNTSHWHIENNKFVRMGCAVVEGYLSLEVLRRVRSRTKAVVLSGDGILTRIIKSAPKGSDAYSLKSGKYIKHADGRHYLIEADGSQHEVICASAIVDLIYIDHAQEFAVKTV